MKPDIPLPAALYLLRAIYQFHLRPLVTLSWAKFNQTPTEQADALCLPKNHFCTTTAVTTAGIDLNVEGSQQYTPLQHAAKIGNLDMLAVLLDAGADIDQQSTKDGKAALHLAAQSGHVQCVDLLLSRQASTDIQDKLGRPPLVDALLPKLSRRQTPEYANQKKVCTELLYHANPKASEIRDQHGLDAQSHAQAHAAQNWQAAKYILRACKSDTKHNRVPPEAKTTRNTSRSKKLLLASGSLKGQPKTKIPEPKAAANPPSIRSAL